MDETGRLEKVESIKQRTGLSYSEAAALLDQADGDVLQALILHEQRSKKQKGPQWDVFEAKGSEILDRVKELLKRGNVTKVIIKKDDSTIAEIPVTAGVIGAIIAPQLAILGSAACLLGRCSIEVEYQGESRSEIKLDEDGNPLD